MGKSMTVEKIDTKVIDESYGELCDLALSLVKIYKEQSSIKKILDGYWHGFAKDSMKNHLDLMSQYLENDLAMLECMLRDFRIISEGYEYWDSSNPVHRDYYDKLNGRYYKRPGEEINRFLKPDPNRTFNSLQGNDFESTNSWNNGFNSSDDAISNDSNKETEPKIYYAAPWETINDLDFDTLIDAEGASKSVVLDKINELEEEK